MGCFFVELSGRQFALGNIGLGGLCKRPGPARTGDDCAGSAEFVDNQSFAVPAVAVRMLIERRSEAFDIQAGETLQLAQQPNPLVVFRLNDVALLAGLRRELSVRYSHRVPVEGRKKRVANSLNICMARAR